MNEKESKIVYAIFNKHNGVLFNFEAEKSVAYSYNEKNFLIREITLHPGEYFFGDYYTGKVYLEDEKPLVREDEMEEEFYQSILQQCSLIKQIIAIASVLDANKDLIKTETFNNFIQLLKTKKLKYDRSLKTVSEDKESFNFLSIKDLDEIAIKRMEGIV